MKFLVVDDSKLARLSLIKVLKNAIDDPDVEQAENGEVAVEKAIGFQPDIVFLDLTMPVMNGYEALPKILEVSSRSKVIVVSADVQEQAKEKVISLGAQLHVQKPINQEKMEDILSLFIGKKMQAEIKLTEDQRDVLQELMNVAYGNATAVVAEMLDAFASLSIPKIETMKTSELLEKFESLKTSSYFFSTQAFMGEFNGESAFFIDEDSANNLATHLELEDKDDLDDAILELTNVLTSSLTTRLAQEMDTQISFSLPSVTKIPISEVVHTEAFQHYSHVIVIDTELNFEDQKIRGEIFILTKDGSIEWLKQRLDEILEALI